MTKDTIKAAANRFAPDAPAFIIAALEPNGNPGFTYHGDRRQLTVLFRMIRDQLREREGIGNHPRRADVRAVRTDV
jgi:hypothetical protein